MPFLLCGFAASSTLSPRLAHAQSLSVAVIDEDKLADGYKAYKVAVDAIDKRAQSLDSQIQAREYLPEEEGKTFDSLIVKFSPTPQEATKLDGVIKSGMAKRAAWIGLIGKANRTAEETAQMKGLQDQAARNAPALRNTSDALLAAIRQQQDETDKKFTERADSVVGQVATEKKFSMVARKKALVWSLPSIDITAEVLKRLNAS